MRKCIWIGGISVCSREEERKQGFSKKPPPSTKCHLAAVIPSACPRGKEGEQDPPPTLLRDQQLLAPVFLQLFPFDLVIGGGTLNGSQLNPTQSRLVEMNEPEFVMPINLHGSTLCIANDLQVIKSIIHI